MDEQGYIIGIHNTDERASSFDEFTNIDNREVSRIPQLPIIENWGRGLIFSNDQPYPLESIDIPHTVNPLHTYISSRLGQRHEIDNNRDDILRLNLPRQRPRRLPRIQNHLMRLLHHMSTPPTTVRRWRSQFIKRIAIKYWTQQIECVICMEEIDVIGRGIEPDDDSPATSNCKIIESCSERHTENLDDISVTSCGHCFHFKCITPWLEEHDTCPYCREEIENLYVMCGC